MTISTVSADGKTVDTWSPDRETLEHANDGIHIDPVSHAVIRLEKTADGAHKIVLETDF